MVAEITLDVRAKVVGMWRLKLAGVIARRWPGRRWMAPLILVVINALTAGFGVDTWVGRYGRTRHRQIVRFSRKDDQ